MYSERFELVRDRIVEIHEEVSNKSNAYFEFFFEATGYANAVCAIYDKKVKNALYNRDITQCQTDAKTIYDYLDLESYSSSYLNPDYAARELPTTIAQLLGLVYSDLLSIYAAVYRGDEEYICMYLELLVECFGIIEMNEDSLDIEADLKDTIYWFYHDYSEVFISKRTAFKLDTKEDFYVNLVMKSDLSDNRYLYNYGLYVGDNELLMADHLRSLSDEEIYSIAATYVEGFRKGFEVTGKDLSIKEIVNVEYPIGFERVVRSAVEQFCNLGLSVTIVPEADTSFSGRGGRKRGVYTTSINKQFEFDHKDDKALYLDKSFTDRCLEVSKSSYNTYKDAAKVFAGPAVIEVFGDQPFEPKDCINKSRFNDKQNKINTVYASALGELVNEYIPGDEYSFTIIAYPVPSIGPEFKTIFNKTIELNNLDYERYKSIQQYIIDALDKGEYVHVTGRGNNHTDITVHLHHLDDPAKQTNFENCVADVNIPVGEVFTSPVLEGTNGILHVTSVFLNELNYKNLELTFEDGKIKKYTCSNFSSEKENQDYIFNNVLFHHDTLPIGEFAIGTNTTAYKMGRDFNITDKLPILIAEKTGPHFAVGDTCYSHSEDVPMYNPDGKECIARDNSVSLLRKTNPSAAYFNCHTDITIPYHELGDIVVECLDGNQIYIIKEGRFVVPNTEELNIPLD